MGPGKKVDFTRGFVQYMEVRLPSRLPSIVFLICSLITVKVGVGL